MGNVTCCPYCQSERVITSDRSDKQDFCLNCRKEFEAEEEECEAMEVIV